jgi:hypothetical protein
MHSKNRIVQCQVLVRHIARGCATIVAWTLWLAALDMLQMQAQFAAKRVSFSYLNSEHINYETLFSNVQLCCYLNPTLKKFCFDLV